MKAVWIRIKKDIIDYKYAFAAVAVYAIVTDAFFGRFCPSAIITGFPCPACGITRATGMIIKGAFTGAFQMHVLIYPFILLFVCWCWLRYVKGKRTDILLKWAIMLGVLSFVYYGWRMYQYFPHQEPLEIWERSLFHYFSKRYTT